MKQLHVPYKYFPNNYISLVHARRRDQQHVQFAVSEHTIRLVFKTATHTADAENCEHVLEHTAAHIGRSPRRRDHRRRGLCDLAAGIQNDRIRGQKDDFQRSSVLCLRSPTHGDKRHIYPKDIQGAKALPASDPAGNGNVPHATVGGPRADPAIRWELLYLRVSRNSAAAIQLKFKAADTAKLTKRPSSPNGQICVRAFVQRTAHLRPGQSVPRRPTA